MIRLLRGFKRKRTRINKSKRLTRKARLAPIIKKHKTFEPVRVAPLARPAKKLVTGLKIFENKNNQRLSNNDVSRILLNNIKYLEENDARICRERKLRRNRIMKITSGKGMRVKKAVWTPDSYVVCV